EANSDSCCADSWLLTPGSCGTLVYVRDGKCGPRTCGQAFRNGATYPKETIMKLGELAAQLECKLEGPADLEITGVGGMDEANAGEITFLSNSRYLPKLRTTHAGAIIA